MRRFEMTAQQWTNLKKHSATLAGRQLAEDDQLFINAVLYIARTNMPWGFLPQRYGNYKVARSRFLRWKRTGKWPEIFRIVALEPRFHFCVMNEGQEPEE